MLRLITTATTVSILIALGLFLHWSIGAGQWWWAFPLVVGGAFYFYFLSVGANGWREEWRQSKAELKRSNFNPWQLAMIGLAIAFIAAWSLAFNAGAWWLLPIIAVASAAALVFLLRRNRQWVTSWQDNQSRAAERPE